MEITVTRTGGLAGVDEQLGPVDTTRLDRDRAAEVERLVEQIGFFELPADLPSGGGFDLFNYRMTIRSDREEHSVSYDDATPPEHREGIKELMVWLRDNGFEFEPREVASDGVS